MLKMKVIDEKFINTARYGKIHLIHTDKGWCWQYDSILVGNGSYISATTPPTGIYIPYFDDIDNFFETEKDAEHDAYESLSFLYHTNCLNVWC